MAAQKDRNARTKVSRKLNDAEREHIRHTFLSAGGSVPLPVEETAIVKEKKEAKDSCVTAVHSACFYNHSDALADVIRSEIVKPECLEKINYQDSIGLTVLHLLCGFNGSSRFIQALEILLEHGANARLFDLRGYTPLHYLCFNTTVDTEIQVQALNLLVRNGADVNAREFRAGASPLHILCNYTTFKKLDELLSFFILHRVNLHARTIENRTALHYLCRTNRGEHLLNAVALMMRHGADANIRDDKNMTALHEVCLFYNQPDLDRVIDQLLSAKATCINTGSMHKRTALHLIAIHYHFDNLPQLLKSLIEKHGADPNQGDDKYRSPFHYLLQWSRCSRFYDAVQVMIQHGADARSKDIKQGRMAIHNAALNFYQIPDLPKIISLLLKSEADPNALDKDRRSILHYLTSASAVDLDLSECVDLLLPLLTSQTVDSVSMEGTTALTQAARLGCVATLKRLIPIASKNVTDSFGKNVLDYLKEMRERKVRSLCSCCRADSSLELPPNLIKQLLSKEKMRTNQSEVDVRLFDKSPYIRVLDNEDRLVKPPSARWLQFLQFWKTAEPLLRSNDAQDLKIFMRDLTHQCKLAPLLPQRRNKCSWCDTTAVVYNYIKSVADKVGQLDPRFSAAHVLTYGSLAEGTKLIDPDSFHFGVVMNDWLEDPLHPQTVKYHGTHPADEFSGGLASTRLTRHYNSLLEIGIRLVQRFEIFEHWTCSFDGAVTMLYLVCRGKNNQPPMRLTVTLCLSIKRASDSQIEWPDWCRVAERGEDTEYLMAKPVTDDWKIYYPALERDSIRHAGSTVLQVFQLIKLLVVASNSNSEDGSILVQDPSSFILKTSLLIYMELNPPPWKGKDVIQHCMGVIDVMLDKHDFSMSFFDNKNRGPWSQMPLFSPISNETKRVVLLIKYKLVGLLSGRHHTFTI